MNSRLVAATSAGDDVPADERLRGLGFDDLGSGTLLTCSGEAPAMIDEHRSGRGLEEIAQFDRDRPGAQDEYCSLHAFSCAVAVTGWPEPAPR